MTKADILVIGAGGAGLSAAVAASEKGAKVVVVEKNKGNGGNTAMANGFFAIESHIQKRKGVTTTRQDVFSASMDYAHWKINPEIIRAFIDKSGDTIRWLEDKGVSFSLYIEGSGHNQFSTYHGVEGNGKSLIRTLENAARELGVTVMNQTEIKRIVKDEHGAVSGVIFVSKGAEVTMDVKAVIIATGGYGGNREMMKKYYRQYTDNILLMGSPCEGAGIQLAISAGAETEGLGTIHLHGSCFKGSRQIDALSRQPHTLWVNKNGKRFCDESLTFLWPECGNILEQQPGNMLVSLSDTKILELMKTKGTRALVLNVPPQTKLEEMDNRIREKSSSHRVKIANDWTEISDWMGIPAGPLEKTIENYNSMCVNRQDSLYYKNPEYLMTLDTPPFYAIECHASYLGTLGGIKINHNMETISTDGNPIPGLYTAGQDAGGWVSSSYNIRLPGTTCGFAVNSGRIAGETAAGYISAGRFRR